jgi:hypothetical protein
MKDGAQKKSVTFETEETTDIAITERVKKIVRHNKIRRLTKESLFPAKGLQPPRPTLVPPTNPEAVARAGTACANKKRKLEEFAPSESAKLEEKGKKLRR